MNTTYIFKKKKIIRIGVLVACILLTVIYVILIYHFYQQREQVWNRHAKAAFLEAVGNEVKKLDKIEKDGSYTATSLFQQMALEADIPDSVVITLKVELMFFIFLYTGVKTLILKMEIGIFISA